MKRMRWFPYEFEFIDDLIYFHILQGTEFICDGDNREVSWMQEDDE